MEAEVLSINNSEPVLVMETKLYTRNDRLIGWRKAIHRADDYKLSFTGESLSFVQSPKDELYIIVETQKIHV